MRAIRLHFEPFATYPTVEAAIEAANARPPLLHPEAAASLAGRSVFRVDCTEESIRITIGERCLAVSATVRDDVARMRLSVEPARDVCTGVQCVCDAVVQIEFANGSTSAWDRLAPLNAILGKKFLRIEGNQRKAWIYFSENLLLAVSPAVDVHRSLGVLYWDLSE